MMGLYGLRRGGGCFFCRTQASCLVVPEVKVCSGKTNKERSDDVAEERCKERSDEPKVNLGIPKSKTL